MFFITHLILLILHFAKVVQEPVIKAAGGVKLSLRVCQGLGGPFRKWDILRCRAVKIVKHQINTEGYNEGTQSLC